MERAVQEVPAYEQRGDEVNFHSMRYLLQAFLISMLVAFLGVQAAQGSSSFKLAAVSVAGSNRYKSPEITPVTGLTIGSSVTFADLEEAAERLASTGVFADVTYRYTTLGNTMTVTFVV